MRPAVFLDRDGVLVKEVYYPQTGETEAPLFAEDVALLPGVGAALGALRDRGYALVVISNQGGYAKGKTSLRNLWLAHLRFDELLKEQGVTLDDAHYSYTHPNGVTPHVSGLSLDRKPSPLNVLIAAARLDLDLSSSWMIGDRETDVECGQKAGARTVRIGPAGIRTSADLSAIDIESAVRAVLAA
jgi:D-glycero-D-manno-heptose 1,7-bisphosphate phosphatase